jgi:hypothetical protein
MGVFLAAGAAEAQTPAKPERFLTGTAALSIQSAAVWRGELVTRNPTPLLSPSLSVTFGGLVTLWGEATYDARTDTKTVRHGNRLLTEETRYTEKTFGVSLSHDTKLAELSLDASLTELSEGTGNPVAASLGITFHAPLSPGIEVARDLNGPGNWYLAPHLEPRVVLSDAFRLDLRGSIGYYVDAELQSRFFFVSEAPNPRYSGFSDATATATLTYEPGAVHLALKALYTTFLSKEVRLRVGQEGQPSGTFLGQLTLAYDF